MLQAVEAHRGSENRCARETERRELVGMDFSELRTLLGPEQPPYRARQLYDALYREQVAELSEISALPKQLRNELVTENILGLPSAEQRFDSADGTRRYLLRLSDGRTVETVLMPEEGRDTIFISSQVGCPVDCKFFLTALMGL
jgi:23S rRNA (adenine2503-C2)-methyltransferase